MLRLGRRALTLWRPTSSLLLLLAAACLLPSTAPFLAPIRRRYPRCPVAGLRPPDPTERGGRELSPPPPTPTPTPTPTVELTPEQDSALRSYAPLAVERYGYSWFRSNRAAMDDARSTHPELGGLSDDEIREAYLKLKPRLLDVFLSTPLGPFLLINLIFYATGFSWCDTPLGNEAACRAIEAGGL